MPSIHSTFAQIGRVVYFHLGPLKGQFAVIVDIVDHNRAIIDAPAGSDVFRMVVNFKKVRLTDIVVDIPRGATTEQVTEVAERENLADQFKSTDASQKYQKEQAKRNLTDFDRFKIRTYSLQRNAIVRAEFEKLKSQDRKSNEDSYSKLDRAARITQRATRLRRDPKKPRHFRRGV